MHAAREMQSGIMQPKECNQERVCMSYLAVHGHQGIEVHPHSDVLRQATDLAHKRKRLRHPQIGSPRSQPEVTKQSGSSSGRALTISLP